ncbi:MAG: hypothetical protein KJ573_05000 [Proteobacteria bacterium]|nr:hypothetical protein [Pseudomonadota bacterium]
MNIMSFAPGISSFNMREFSEGTRKSASPDMINVGRLKEVVVGISDDLVVPSYNETLSFFLRETE